jgi:hypothetical protein
MNIENIHKDLSSLVSILAPELEGSKRFVFQKLLENFDMLSAAQNGSIQSLTQRLEAAEKKLLEKEAGEPAQA